MGKGCRTEVGTPQGGSISPLLANIYLHYALDLWVQQWRRTKAHGEVIIVRWADDFIVGFQHKSDALKFWGELAERLRRFNLELHPDKTKLLEFGRFAAANRKKRGERKPKTFTFLGFTHICGQTRKGWFTVQRKTDAKRLRSRLRRLKLELRRRLHDPVPKVGGWLGKVLRGWYNYHAIPMNYPALNRFRHQVALAWRRALARRSQKARLLWKRMDYLINRYLPRPKILHPYPSKRLACLTQGRSPVR